LGEAAERQAGSFLIADSLLDLERLGVPRLGRVEVARDGVEDAVGARGKSLAPGEAEGAAPLDALPRPLEPGVEIESDQPEALAERTHAELAIRFALGGDAIRVAPFVVRARELTQHVRRQSRREKRARPPHGGRAISIGVEEGRSVLPGGQVLAADVPVHPQVAAHLQARFGSSGVTVARRRQERVERGLKVALLGDAAF